MKYDFDRAALDLEGATLEEEGAYARIVRHGFKNGPLSEQACERLCRGAWPFVKSVMTEKDGGLVIPWVQEAREAAEAKCDNASKAGKASATKRSKRSTTVQQELNDRSTNVEQPLNECSTSLSYTNLSIDSNTKVSIDKVSKSAREEIQWPAWAGVKTKAAWEQFKTYRTTLDKFKYKSTASEQAAVNTLTGYFSGGPQLVAALEHAMAKGWKFPVDPSEYKYPALAQAEQKLITVAVDGEHPNAPKPTIYE
ncbi:MAG: hypothetical protein ACK54F_03600 [Planctomycetia bacterium]|jgi:hypothetical protein